ncbi:diphthine--ammonia ligase [Bacillus sp. UNC438CL73TsuS30]|uniref:Dph6-related ATP pyrophosphatase n=1 Tax=Bacillus sp. UNC438CL73TsuS30 TaxID=1340434 RepID=UPI0006918731|nr:diphthine--ammonia ligase [Bacillus sp. UNC438CL73TsuS30]
MGETVLENIVVAFSSGKDSVFLVNQLLKDQRYKIISLVTTCTDNGNVTSHHIDEQLVEKQAEAIGLPLYKIKMSEFTTEKFEDGLISTMVYFRAHFGVTKIAYGDLFLEEVKTYKEKLLAKHGFELLLPLWGQDTKTLAQQMVEEGWKAAVISIDSTKLSSGFLGKTLTKEWLEALPSDVDPCGEYGEYHTFVYHGPIFKYPIPIEIDNKFINAIDRWKFVGIKLKSNDLYKNKILAIINQNE